MAHSKQAQKRDRNAERKRIHNKGITSRMRTEVKRVLDAVAKGEVDAAKQLMPSAMRQIDKAAKSHIIHRNAASNRKSMLARAILRVSNA